MVCPEQVKVPSAVLQASAIIVIMVYFVSYLINICTNLSNCFKQLQLTACSPDNTLVIQNGNQSRQATYKTDTDRQNSATDSKDLKQSITALMMSARIPVTLFLCLFCSLTGLFSPTFSSAAERLEVRIRSTILNIRETTSTKSPIVDVLQQGELLTVTTTGLADWIKLDDGRGYISIHYVDVLTRTPVDESPAQIAEKADQTAASSVTGLPADTAAESDLPAAEAAQAISAAIETADTGTDTSQDSQSETTPAAPASPAIESSPSTPLTSTAAALESASVNTETPVDGQLPDSNTLPDIAVAPAPATQCSPRADNTDMRITSVATTCRRNLKTLYYEACDVAFNLEFISRCDQKGSIDISCTAVAHMVDARQQSGLTELTQEATIYLKDNTKARQKLVWMPATPNQQITDIQLRDKHCILN